MSDSVVQRALPSDEQTTNEPTSDNSSSSTSDVNNTSTPSRLFGQFKQNGFGFHNVSKPTFGETSSREKSDDDNSSSSTYFTSALSKLSSTTAAGFGTSSAPLATSLASLGANKPLFGGSSSTAPSSFTDLKPTSTNSLQNKTDDDEDKDDEDDNKASLLETVAEYEAKRASTHPAATIQGDTSTGEENEVTKFQITGKLFMYSGEQQQFIERGYGTLKINESHDPSDWDRLQARLIMRLDKSFRVILNSPIFPKMTVDRVTDRSVRFGAQDESQLRVFIIKASTNDCSNLFKELQSRIEIIERQQTSTASNINTSINNSSTNSSSDVVTLDDSSSKQISPSAQRKRSHSKSDSDASENTNDLSKKSKLVEENQESKKDVNQSTSEDDSVQETANS